MTDKLIGGLFARARKAKERRYVASTRDVGRLMRLFHGTIEALETAQQEQRDGFAVVDEVVGWAKLTRVRGEVRTLADLAEEDPLLGAADRSGKRDVPADAPMPFRKGMEAAGDRERSAESPAL